jgi:hypothetical protein
MNLPELKHPFLAIIIIFGICGLIQEYGISDGSFLIIDFLLGIVVYKIISYWVH